ncbi:integrase [Pasteurellaceae bacterium RH1A]|nr:integrase [Pasteurellaceae bacterium RH1A]QIW15798.1 integrase [Pasteurellaceae bacterium RH1A]QIW15940.1 integrase [Pasteurellaceae bacterium RH1A]QIW16291.1 integrase [Pasteurellaceae bacterium RH1A]QIW16531.1 integrase [Pasteurellaceae bacterium RH1A]
MAWKQTNPMEQKTLFIKAWLSQRFTKSDLCEQFGISRPTANKWIERFKQGGFPGLQELSRKPHYSPNATPQWIVEWLVSERRKRPDWGAKKLLDLFEQRFPEAKKPADSTGDLILARAGLVKPRKVRRHTPADSLPFAECDAPNTTWCVDFKGQFQLGDQKWCYPLTVSDQFCRYLLLCQALPNTLGDPVKAQFERLFYEFGLPWNIRSDNGSPFASTALGGLSKLAKWWIDLGIRPERIRPAHPEQNGHHERMHRSLKACLLKREAIAGNLADQQAMFDAFVHEYNHERSHESLLDDDKKRQTPASLYQPSSRIYTGKIEDYDYGQGVELRRVKPSGELCWQGEIYYLSQILKQETVAFVPYADGIWHIYYRFHFLGQMDDREKKITPASSWHINHTM